MRGSNSATESNLIDLMFARLWPSLRLDKTAATGVAGAGVY